MYFFMVLNQGSGIKNVKHIVERKVFQNLPFYISLSQEVFQDLPFFDHDIRKTASPGTLFLVTLLV